MRLALLVMCGTTIASAQDRHFTRYGHAEGLPQLQVFALHQDRDGFLWMGTYGGLTRFDGVSFRTYARADGLTSNTVVALTEDSDGRLVVGLRDGLCVRLTDRFRCMEPDEVRRAGQTVEVLAGSAGSLWLASANGLTGVDSAGRVEWIPLPGGEGATAIGRDNTGGLLIATADGLFRRDGTVFTEIPGLDLRGHEIHTIRPTVDGFLIATAQQVFMVRGESPRALPGLASAREARITAAIVASDGGVLIATLRGVLRYADGRYTPISTQEGSTEDEVNTVYEDRDATTWLGTESGLVRVTSSPFTNYTEAAGLPHAFVRALAEDPSGRIWVGTRGGIAVRDGDRFRSVPLPGFDQLRVYGFAFLPRSGMLVATREGLMHFDGRLRQRYAESDGLPDRFVLAVLTDPAGGAWVGTVGGLVRWEDGRIRTVSDSLLSRASVVALSYDARGRLWVGLGDGGMLVHDGSTTRFLGAANGLSDETVWTLGADDRGGMWIGTNGDGAFRVDTADTIERFDVSDGLVNPFVWQVLTDARGDTWFYTNQGLTRRSANGSVAHFGLVDGLAELEGSAGAVLETSDGSLWFGSGSGVARYRAGATRPLDGTRLIVRIEEASVGGRMLPLDAVRIERRAGAVQVRYSAPALRDATSIRFRYRLSSASAWTDAGTDRAITIANLGPGRHLLEILAVDGRGRTSAQPARLALTMAPAFYQTWWFRSLAGLLFTALAIGVPMARTRRHRAERARLESLVAARTEAQRESEERLRVVIEQSTNLFFSYNADRELTYASPQSEQIFGLTPDEMKGRWREAFTDHPLNAEAVHATDRALATGERQPPYEFEIRHTDGSLVRVRVNEAPVVKDGRTVAMVGSLTNITEEKAARASEARLAEQLRQAQKLEAIGRLAGGIAHDFNNLLTAVVGHAELAAEGLSPENPAREDIAEVLRASGRASALVAQLMAFSRQQIIKRTTLDLNVIVQESARMLHRIIGSDVQLTVAVAEVPAWILADQGQLDQILVNLVANARDAMPSGGRLSIAASHQTLAEHEETDVPAGGYVVLKVRDEGTGMDADTRARLFEPFFTTKAQGAGTGLGLATVYGIIKQNGWYITLVSAPDQGATFRIFMPSQEAPAPVQQGAVVEAPALPAGGQRVVLVVEDEEGVRSLICRTLRQHDFHVIDAADGATALARAAAFEGHIDLLLTDVVMPGMNGKQVATAFSAERPSTPVLFMTGHSMGMLGTRGIVADATHVLLKPFRPTELLRRVQETLN